MYIYMYIKARDRDKVKRGKDPGNEIKSKGTGKEGMI